MTVFFLILLAFVVLDPPNISKLSSAGQAVASLVWFALILTLTYCALAVSGELPATSPLFW